MRDSGARPPIVVLFVAALFLLASCGGAQPMAEMPEPAEEDAEQSEEPIVGEASGKIEIEGLLGTIAESDVERVVNRKMERLAECYGEALEVLEEIEGSIELAMTVNSNGQVVDAYLRSGDLGSNVAQRCMVEQMSRFVFPSPAGGGRAIISYLIELPAPYNHPKPYNWGGGKSSDVVSEHMADMERCLKGKTGVQLTLYVGRGGRVVSAGGTSDTFEMYQAAECLAEAAMAWQYPDPGDRPAKAVLEF